MMMFQCNIVLSIVMLHFVCVVNTEVYDVCTFVNDLVNNYGISQSDAAMWSCIADHESSYDTDAIGMQNSDGTYDYGIMQINSGYWCSGGPGNPDNNNGCSVTCQDLLSDDLGPSVACAEIIIQQDGWAAWSTDADCQGDLSSYTAGCFK